MRPSFAYTSVVLLLTTLLAGGCVPAIGDECSTDGDCPANAICDSTAPGGYCTIPDCTTGGCPNDSICVEFGRETAYCMKHCDDDSDCREQYTCRESNNSRQFCYVADSQ
ncbi:MAG: hypothetical protein ABEN55_20240 [Bradymonadaceae bacterium]